MTRMVQATVAGDVAEAEEIQALLLDAGIDSELEAEREADALKVLVPEEQLEAAQDLIQLSPEGDDVETDL